MAFTFADIDEFMQLLREHPDWRERLRRELLPEEFASVPDRLSRIEGILEHVAQQLSQLTGRVDQLTQSINRLTGRVDQLEGWRYESQFHAASRVAAIVRRARAVNVGDLDEVIDARDEGRLTVSEFEGLQAADFLFRGRLGKGPDAEERLVVVEVSVTVDEHDIECARQRADTLVKCGLSAIAVAGGRRLAAGAAAYAEQQGVRLLIDRSSEPDSARD